MDPRSAVQNDLRLWIYRDGVGNKDSEAASVFGEGFGADYYNVRF